MSCRRELMSLLQVKRHHQTLQKARFALCCCGYRLGLCVSFLWHQVPRDVKSLDKFLCFRSSCLDDGLSLSLTLAVAFEVLPQDTAEFAAGSAAPPDPGEGSLCTLLSWMQRVSNDFEWQIVLWTVCWVCWLCDIPVEKVRTTLELVVESLFVWEKLLAINQILSDTVVRSSLEVTSVLAIPAPMNWWVCCRWSGTTRPCKRLDLHFAVVDIG